jgi:hypothetical protein
MIAPFCCSAGFFLLFLSTISREFVGGKEFWGLNGGNVAVFGGISIENDKEIRGKPVEMRRLGMEFSVFESES